MPAPHAVLSTLCGDRYPRSRSCALVVGTASPAPPAAVWFFVCMGLQFWSPSGAQPRPAEEPELVPAMRDTRFPTLLAVCTGRSHQLHQSVGHDERPSSSRYHSLVPPPHSFSPRCIHITQAAPLSWLSTTQEEPELVCRESRERMPPSHAPCRFCVLLEALMTAFTRTRWRRSSRSATCTGARHACRCGRTWCRCGRTWCRCGRTWCRCSRTWCRCSRTWCRDVQARNKVGQGRVQVCWRAPATPIVFTF